EGRQGRPVEGRRREDQEGSRGCRRHRRAEVSSTCVARHQRRPPEAGGESPRPLAVPRGGELTVGSSGRGRAGAGNTSDFQLAIPMFPPAPRNRGPQKTPEAVAP